MPRYSHVFIAATYHDVAEADADYEAVRLLYSDIGRSESFDAVAIAWKASGDARLHRRHDQRSPPDSDPGTAWSLAAGLAAVLFPSVGVGGPAADARAGDRRSAVAGEIARSLSRTDLMELGAHLDTAAAALIVAAAVDHADRTAGALSRAHTSMQRSADVDVDAIERVLHITALVSRSTRPPGTQTR
jgi:hypothetical protein